MSVLKFDKDSVSQSKESLINPKIELYNVLRDINKNLDIIKENWKGQRATTTLSSVDGIKSNNDLLLKRLEESITLLGGVIKTYDIAENSGVVGSASGLSASSNSLGGLSSLTNTSKLYSVTFKGEEYYSVNTPIKPLDYLKVIKKNKLWQGFALGSQCMIAAQIYAVDMMNGTPRTFEEFKKMVGSPAVKMNKDVSSENIEVVKAALFEGIQKGYPMVLQVSRKIGGRHFVTVVGFKKGVTSSSQLTEANILVIDNADGNIQTLSERNRKIYKTSNGKYRVLGPIDKFAKSTSNSASA